MISGDEDEAEQAAFDWQRARWSGQFRKEVTPLADGWFYWHLFRNGVRVNGGLSRTREDAFADAGFAVRQHFWDLDNSPETSR